MFKLLTIWLLSKHCDHLRPHMNSIKDMFSCCQNVQGIFLCNSKNMLLKFILCQFLTGKKCKTFLTTARYFFFFLGALTSQAMVCHSWSLAITQNLLQTAAIGFC